MNNLDKKGIVTAELLAIIVVPGALTGFLLYKLAKKVGLIDKDKSFKMLLQK